MHSTLILLTLALAVTSFPAFAQTSVQAQASHELKQFCSDPVSYVCDPELDQTAAEKVFAEKSHDALNGVAEKLGYPSGQIDYADFYNRVYENPERFAPALAEYGKKFISIANEAVYAETSEMPQAHLMIQKAFKAAKKDVEALYLEQSKWWNFFESSHVDRIRSLQFLTPLDFAPIKTYAAPYLPNYSRSCSLPTLLGTPTSNAFYVKGSNTIFICPGDLVNTILRSSDPDYLLTMKFNFGHEIAHSFYANYNSTAVTTCMQEEVTSVITGNAKLRRHLALRDTNEFVADLYALKLVVNHLKQITEKTASATTLRRLHATRRAYRDLCGTPPFDGHPSGDVRIEQILRRHPDVDALFGCGAWKTKVPHYACTLTGRSAEKY